jgi:hypothetical protein
MSDKRRAGEKIKQPKHPAGDDGGGGYFTPGGCDLGLGQSMNQFIGLVDAILDHPNQDALFAGRDGPTDATSNLFWVYGSGGTLHAEAAAGYLTTRSGNGGFDLTVQKDGSWSLSFDGSHQTIGHQAGTPAPEPPQPPAGLPEIDVPGGAAAAYYDATTLTGPAVINGGLGWDTIQGGIGDYMIGGSGTNGGGLAGQGNCALYTASPGSVLVDMENGFGYGGNAEGNVYANMNQTRGSLLSNVLIGATSGTDLKSGGGDSVLISTGGVGFELRPDGANNLLVSTVGGDRVVFDPTHGWQLGDDNVMVGFNLSHGCTLDLSALLSSETIGLLNGTTVASDFFSTTAAGYSAASGTGDINDYVSIVNEADGSHVMFSATGQVATSGTELIDLLGTHGLSVGSMAANHQILI